MSRIINETTTIVPIDSVQPHPDNPRQGDLGAIIQSVETHGFYGQVVVQKSTGRILAGNHRWMAARHAGLEEVPVTFVDVSDEVARRILVADNRTSDLGTYDDAVLAGILKDLAASEMGLDGTGYDGDDLDALLGELDDGHPFGAVPPRMDERDALCEKWGVADGQVWVAGKHRIACGDSRESATLYLAVDGQPADCLWTDPPYGVDYVGKTAAKLTIKNDDAPTLAALLESFIAAATDALAPGAPFYIACPPGANGITFRCAIRDAGWRFHQTLVWVKDTMVLGHSDHHLRHEEILYGWTPGEGRSGRGAHDGTRWYGDNAQTSVFEFDRPDRSEDHPTMKPPALIAKQIHNSTPSGGRVLDPFMGSGSTIVACQESGRVGIGVEIDPGYVAVTLERLAEMGLTPERVQ